MNVLRCEVCDIEIHGRDVYFDGLDSFCRHCNNPLDDGSGRKRRRAPSASKQEVPLPKNVTVDRKAGRDGITALVVKVPWRIQRPQDGLRLFGWIVVSAVVLGAIQLGATKLVAFLLGALVLALMLSVRLINRTTIVVRADTIRLTHGPLPWVSRRLDTSRLEQLYVNRRPIAQHVFDYSVRALLEDGSDIVFLRALKEPAVAFYLESCIEDHLQIEDRAVRGEYVAPPPPDPTASGPYLDPQHNIAIQQRQDPETGGPVTF